MYTYDWYGKAHFRGKYVICLVAWVRTLLSIENDKCDANEHGQLREKEIEIYWRNQIIAQWLHKSYHLACTMMRAENGLLAKWNRFLLSSQCWVWILA